MTSEYKKKYSQAIANWPVEERPREKLILKGPESLSDAELLAIFLRVGVKGKNAIVLAQDLLAKFGSLRGLYAAPVDELRAVLGIGDAKIAQFKAVIEMSKRYLAEGFHDRPYVESSEDIMKLLSQEMRDLDQEVFKVVLLNGQNHVLNILEVARGSLTAPGYIREKLSRWRSDIPLPLSSSFTTIRQGWQKPARMTRRLQGISFLPACSSA